MFPLSLFDSCDHEYGEEEEYGMVYPNRIFFDGDEMWVYRETLHRQDCKRCSHYRINDVTEECVFLSEERVEEVERE